MQSIYTETPLKAKPIEARSHFEKTYKSEMVTFFSINTSQNWYKFEDLLKINQIWMAQTKCVIYFSVFLEKEVRPLLKAKPMKARHFCGVSMCSQKNLFKKIT